jgi:hypothetical protein
MSDPTQPPNDLQAYETAFHALLSAVHVIAARLQAEGHALTAPLKAELHKAVLAQGRWLICRHRSM